MTDIHIPTLADRALLVHLKRARMSTSKRAKALEAVVRDDVNDDSLTINMYIFKDRSNPVRKLLSEYDGVYAAPYKAMTGDWISRGPRVLLSEKFYEFMERMNVAMGNVTRLVPGIQANWSTYVQQDLDRRMAKHTPASRMSLPSIDDYPTADMVPSMFSFDLKVFPIPDEKDFRVDVGEAGRQAVRDALREAEDTLRANAIRSLLLPLQRAVEKLAVPIGEDGSIFRDSLVENIRSGVQWAREWQVNDPELNQLIDDLDTALGQHAPTPEALRTTQTGRDTARGKFDDIMKRLGEM